MGKSMFYPFTITAWWVGRGRGTGMLALGPWEVVVASSATAERSFSSLRRLKTYLRSTMGQERLNHVLILNVHQDKTDSIDLKSVARDFISLNDVKRNIFGHLDSQLAYLVQLYRVLCINELFCSLR